MKEVICTLMIQATPILCLGSVLRDIPYISPGCEHDQHSGISMIREISVIRPQSDDPIHLRSACDKNFNRLYSDCS